MSTSVNDIQPERIEETVALVTGVDAVPTKANTDVKKPRTLEDEVGVTLDDIEISSHLAFKVAKDALPENAKIGKDPKLALGKSATVFLSYLGAVAQELAAEKNHKLISADDVFNALKLIEFPEFIDPIKEYVEVAKEAARAKKLNTADTEVEKPAVEEEANAMQD